MDNYIIEFSVELSPYAYQFYKSITQNELIRLIAGLAKIIKNSRYRDFSSKPIFYTDSFGKRKAVKIRRKDKKHHHLKFNLPVSTLNSIKELQALGHSPSWIIEESLYYGLRQNSK